ncbi:Leucine-rich repeat protein [Dioscorea alata]|uniref:Leucine-rich repeat protein n=1 Tax=Dioscorea alata TaxID=55571 RepID=A0ACB7WKI8_DIOAL|nr:Leucine-rich repeat protein [Dioscorea alata]
MLFWVLLLVHLVLQQPNGCFACVEQEKIALLDIKSAFTDGHESNANPYSIESWNKSIDCCSWYGVHCSPATKHVRSLGLYHSYKKTLNVSLLLPFQELRSLSLSYNEFNSCIPYLDLSWNYFDSKALSSLAALSSLKALSLQNFWMETEFFINGVSGALSKLSKLKYLDLSDNYLNGSIIPYLGQMSSLKTLDLSENQIGEGLDLNGLCKIKNLQELDIGYNNFKGNIPLCFGHLSSLEYIDISYNQFGTLFFSSIIKNLTMLKYAFFSNNNFEGILSIGLFSNKSNLKELDLSNNYQLEVQTEHLGILPSFQLNKIFLSNCILNKLSGFIPTFLSNQYMIEYIELSSVNLKGNFPQWLFKNNTKLMGLDLGNNSLDGPLAFPSNKTNLLAFDVSNNHFTGTIPNDIGYILPNLTHLDMSHNLLQGVIPSSFGSLNSLSFVDLSYNTLSGVLPNCIRNLSHLRVLNLRENKLEGDLAFEFCHSSNTKYLHLSKYNFSGLVPSCINMSSLEYLNSNGNRLTGPFPSALLASSLAVLDIGNNNFIGSIPRRSYDYKGGILNKLFGLDLSGNQFDGKIPKKIGEMTWLRALNLSSNRLTGPIPATLSRLRDIESLDLSHNMLIGTLPSQLTELHFLQVFLVAYNNLSGPTLGLVAQFSTFDESSYEGNPYLCGPPLVKQCASMVIIQVTNDDDYEDAMSHILFFASFALGFITGFWGWMALLYFKRSWQYSFFLAIDKYMKEALDMANYLLMKMMSLW